MTAGSEHGTPSGYSRHRRRGEPPCEPCREANRAYERQYNAANPDKVAAKSRRWRAVHGGERNERRRQKRAAAGGMTPADRAYLEAHRGELREAAARFYRAAQADTREEASHSREPWDAWELEIAVRADLSIKEAALMLGRTYGSVARMRSILRRRQQAVHDGELGGAA